MISREAPTKLVPWLLHMSVGFPRREMNILRCVMKASVVRYENNSKCTAFTESETNTQV